MSKSRVESEFNFVCDINLFISKIFGIFYDSKISKYQGVNFVKLKVKIYYRGILSNGRADFTVSVKHSLLIVIYES